MIKEKQFDEDYYAIHIRGTPSIFKSLPPELKNNKDFVIKVLQKFSEQNFARIGETSTRNMEIAKELHEWINKDEDVLLEVFKIAPDYFHYTDGVKNPKSLTKDVALKIMDYNPKLLVILPLKWKNNFDVCLKATLKDYSQFFKTGSQIRKSAPLFLRSIYDNDVLCYFRIRHAMRHPRSSHFTSSTEWTNSEEDIAFNKKKKEHGFYCDQAIKLIANMEGCQKQEQTADLDFNFSQKRDDNECLAFADTEKLCFSYLLSRLDNDEFHKIPKSKIKAINDLVFEHTLKSIPKNKVEQKPRARKVSIK